MHRTLHGFRVHLQKGLSLQLAVLQVCCAVRQCVAHRGIHGVGGEAACEDLANAGQQAAGADGHEGDVQIRRIHILARRQVLVAARDLWNAITHTSEHPWQSSGVTTLIGMQNSKSVEEKF